ncbi:MAG: 5-methylcytosine restriction system component-like protein [Herbinix sp.]|jgi:5-methylcytosine-specific restriction endonuclease McrBC regulatory subunit McrC|nr:5-methylcytosine restriction system component-like protein [Herbinix sp.]
MVQNSYWEEGSKHQWLFCANDNSSLDKLQEKVNIDTIQYAANDEPVNLGIRRVNGRVYSGNYVGLCRLKCVNGKNLLSYDGREVILRIEPRFPVSVVDMLNALRDDDEFERYLAPQTTRIDTVEKEIEDLKNNELFYFFDGEDPIFVEDNIALNSSIITASVFLSLLKDLCSRPLMGKMVIKEENLVGKAKGKILFKNNIRNNTLRGRNDRLYCRYLQYSEDILENQVLKAALHKATLFLNRYFGSASGNSNSFREMTAYCQNALRHLTYTKILRQDLIKIKTTGCYVYYKPVINAAKMVLNEITLGANGDSKFTCYVIPYAVSMDKLFEMYVRTYLKQAGIKSYLSSEEGLHMLKYDYKSKVLEQSDNLYSNYINGNVKPDIIIHDTKKNKYVVFDVKYKNIQNRGYSRADRLQILAYALMYDCDNVGIVFPSLTGVENEYYAGNAIQSIENRERYYNQLEFSIDTNWHCIIKSKDGQEEIPLIDYIKKLLV